MPELPFRHKQRLEREPPGDPDPDIDHERQSRIEAEARHVTAPGDDR